VTSERVRPGPAAHADVGVDWVRGVSLAGYGGLGYAVGAWRSGVRLCRGATWQGISRPTVCRWCIGPLGAIPQEAVFLPSATRAMPPKTHRARASR